MSYNGWTNYETWNAALWINNDQGCQEYALEIVRDCRDDRTAADALEEAFTGDVPDLGGMMGDLLTTALQAIDWREIAESLRADLDDEDEAEDEDEDEDE